MPGAPAGERSPDEPGPDRRSVGVPAGFGGGGLDHCLAIGDPKYRPDEHADPGEIAAAADFGLVALATGFINSLDALSAIGVQDALVRAPDSTAICTTQGLAEVLHGAMTAAAGRPGAGRSAILQRSAMGLGDAGVGIRHVDQCFREYRHLDFRRTWRFARVRPATLVADTWCRRYGRGCRAVADLWALVVGILVFRAARLVQSYLMSSYRPGLTIRAWRRIIGFSLWSWGQTMLYQAKDRCDSIVIGRFWARRRWARSRLVWNWVRCRRPTGGAAGSRAVFRFRPLHNASERLSNMFLGAVGLGFMLILPAGFGISMLADPMVRLSLGTQGLRRCLSCRSWRLAEPRRSLRKPAPIC